MRRVHLLACAAVAASLAFVSTAVAAPPEVDSAALRAAVTVDGIAGYTASVDYVKQTMLDAGWDVTVTQFDMPDWEETAPPVLEQLTPTAKTYVAGDAGDDNSPAVDFIAFAFSPTADVPSAPVVPTNDVQIPSTGGSTSGCEAEDYPAATDGAIALIQRGTCPFVQKLAIAEAQGAIGVILFNEGWGSRRSLRASRSARSSTTPSKRARTRRRTCRPTARTSLTSSRR